jgi:hypothetical protein
MADQSGVSLHVQGLSKLDRMELAADFKNAPVRFQDEKLPDGQHGELGSTAVIALSLVGLKLLAAWLVKNRKKGRIRRSIEIVKANGERRTETLDVDLSSSESPEAAVVDALATLTKFDLQASLKP